MTSFSSNISPCNVLMPFAIIPMNYSVSPCSFVSITCFLKHFFWVILLDFAICTIRSLQLSVHSALVTRILCMEVALLKYSIWPYQTLMELRLKIKYHGWCFGKCLSIIRRKSRVSQFRLPGMRNIMDLVSYTVNFRVL